MAEREARATDVPAAARTVSASYERHPYLPLGAQQKKLFDAIDGKRTISEIAPRAAQCAAVKVLFEGLWWYDQIVFDTSRPPGRWADGETRS